MTPLIEEGALVLFQGDSITDCGRGREDDGALGCGYAMIASAWFSAAYPERGVRFLNRGIGGNRVAHLRERWQEDCIALAPDWVSIMIGINDTWHGMGSGGGTPIEEWAADYHHILTRVREELDARLILMEPFLVPHPPDRAEWRPDLDPRIRVTRELAREFDALLVPLDGEFAQACARRGPASWAGDGVHPTPAGHALIARAWLRTVGAI